MNNSNNTNRDLNDLDFDNYSGDELLDDLSSEELEQMLLQELDEEKREAARAKYEQSKRARDEKDEVNERLRRAKEEASKDYKTSNSGEKENTSSKKSDLDNDESKEKEKESQKETEKDVQQNSLVSTTNKTANTNSSTETNSSKGDKREVVGKNKEGNELTKPKTKLDKLKDQKRLASARFGKASNTINRARALKHEATHPISTAGQQLGKAGVKAAKKTATLAAKGIKALVTSLMSLTPIGILFLLVFILLIIAAIVGFVLGYQSEQNNQLGYYDAPCQEITVVGTSGHSDSGTFSIEDYVAGVVQNEVGFWNNLVVDEVFAIAARTYVFKTAGETCTIENSTRYQTFTSNPGETAKKAAMNTQGMVITDESGSLLLTQYDALAVKEVTSTDYILKQKDQHIPKSWIESHINSSTLSYYRNHNHGNGISQWGARYLAEQGKSSREIIAYYIGGSIKNTFVGEGLEGVPGYPLMDGNGSILKGQSLANFLLSKGSSIEALNAVISSNVNNAGRGTRAGVVSAAVTLIGEINKYGVKLPYVFGGGHGSIQQGASSSWGSGGGLDCSGFISWAISNGGVSINASDSSSFASLGTVVDLSNEPVLKPGDIIWRPRRGNKVGHVALVVGYDNNNKQYLTAEALGSDYGVLFHKRKFNSSGYKGISMENYYNSH